MAAVSHGTSAKRMTDVHAALRGDLGRNGSYPLTGSHDRMATQGPDRCRPVKGREPAEPVAHSASLDGGCGGPATARQAVMVPVPLAPLLEGESFGSVLCTQCADQC
jgi:hypothetical protein